MNPSCSHGEMKLRNGVKDGRPWSGYFCPTPKGTPDQCGPQFIKENKNVSQQIQSQDSKVIIQILKSIDARLAKIEGNNGSLFGQVMSKKEEIRSEDIPF